MSYSRLHTHKCKDCRTPVECCGTWEWNFDGWPPAICDHYHIHQNGSVRCESCEDAHEAAWAADIAEQEAAG